VLTAGLAAHLLAEMQGGIPTFMALCWFVSNASEALIAAVCVRRLTVSELTFGKLDEVSVFIFAAVLAAFLSSFLDSAFVVLNHWGTGTYWQLWSNRFWSNVVASLILVPVIVTWCRGGATALQGAIRARPFEISVLIALLLIVSFGVFDSRFAPSTPPVLLYLPLPLLLWAALRFGPIGASTSFAIVSFVVIWGARNGLGPLATSSASENALSVQLFLMFAGPSLLFLAAVLKERRKAEETLNESNERLELALEAGRMGVWDWDTRTGAMKWSRENFLLMGIPPFSEHPTYDLWVRRVHPDDLARATASIKKAIAARKDSEYEYRVRWPNGVVRWVEAVARPLYDENGSCHRVMGLLIDITERRSFDELNQKLSHSSRLTALGELAASIAHELNQPMSAILSNVDAAEMLVDSGKAYDGELRRVLDDIRSDDIRASDVIKHVRGLAARHEMQVQPFVLSELIARVLRLMAPSAQRRKIWIHAELADVPLVHADRVHVEQILLNLLLNSMDALDDSAKREIVVRTSSRGEGLVEVAVSDSGNGIAAEML
jgi:integral membrane sensor domain MASE1